MITEFIEKFSRQAFVDLGISITILFIAVFAAWLLYTLLAFIIKKSVKRALPFSSRLERDMKILQKPLRFFLPIIAIFTVWPITRFSPQSSAVLHHLLELFFIGIFGWLLFQSITLIRMNILRKASMDDADNLRARKLITQTQMLEHVLQFLVIILIIAIMLMTFEKVRQVGYSILASAGILGIIIGFAAQKSIATIIAGIQIAFTQPIRIDDVVVLEGEWGRIEEITLTFVVVKIWDQRRLVLPITYFNEKPFQNWTRTTAQILGTVFVYMDYSIPVAAIRSRLEEIVKNSPLWDGRVVNLQVTNSTEKSIELRALVSAKDSPTAWDLRCYVREQLIDFIQQNYPQNLPALRVQLAEEKSVE